MDGTTIFAVLVIGAPVVFQAVWLRSTYESKMTEAGLKVKNLTGFMDLGDPFSNFGISLVIGLLWPMFVVAGVIYGIAQSVGYLLDKMVAKHKLLAEAQDLEEKILDELDEEFAELEEKVLEDKNILHFVSNSCQLCYRSPCICSRIRKVLNATP